MSRLKRTLLKTLVPLMFLGAASTELNAQDKPIDRYIQFVEEGTQTPIPNHAFHIKLGEGSDIIDEDRVADANGVSRIQYEPMITGIDEPNGTGSIGLNTAIDPTLAFKFVNNADKPIITNINGQKIKELNIKPDGSAYFDGTGLADGMYFARYADQIIKVRILNDQKHIGERPIVFASEAQSMIAPSNTPSNGRMSQVHNNPWDALITANQVNYTFLDVEQIIQQAILESNPGDTIQIPVETWLEQEFSFNGTIESTFGHPIGGVKAIYRLNGNHIKTDTSDFTTGNTGFDLTLLGDPVDPRNSFENPGDIDVSFEFIEGLSDRDFTNGATVLSNLGEDNTNFIVPIAADPLTFVKPLAGRLTVGGQSFIDGTLYEQNTGTDIPVQPDGSFYWEIPVPNNGADEPDFSNADKSFLMRTRDDISLDAIQINGKQNIVPFTFSDLAFTDLGAIDTDSVDVYNSSIQIFNTESMDGHRAYFTHGATIDSADFSGNAALINNIRHITDQDNNPVPISGQLTSARLPGGECLEDYINQTINNLTNENPRVINTAIAQSLVANGEKKYVVLDENDNPIANFPVGWKVGMDSTGFTSDGNGEFTIIEQIDLSPEDCSPTPVVGDLIPDWQNSPVCINPVSSQTGVVISNTNANDTIRVQRMLNPELVQKVFRSTLPLDSVELDDNGDKFFAYNIGGNLYRADVEIPIDGNCDYPDRTFTITPHITECYDIDALGALMIGLTTEDTTDITGSSIDPVVIRKYFEFNGQGFNQGDLSLDAVDMDSMNPLTTEVIANDSIGYVDITISPDGSCLYTPRNIEVTPSIVGCYTGLDLIQLLNINENSVSDTTAINAILQPDSTVQKVVAFRQGGNPQEGVTGKLVENGTGTEIFPSSVMNGYAVFDILLNRNQGDCSLDSRTFRLESQAQSGYCFENMDDVLDIFIDKNAQDDSVFVDVMDKAKASATVDISFMYNGDPVTGIDFTAYWQALTDSTQSSTSGVTPYSATFLLPNNSSTCNPENQVLVVETTDQSNAMVNGQPATFIDLADQMANLEAGMTNNLVINMDTIPERFIDLSGFIINGGSGAMDPALIDIAWSTPSNSGVVSDIGSVVYSFSVPAEVDGNGNFVNTPITLTVSNEQDNGGMPDQYQILPTDSARTVTSEGAFSWNVTVDGVPQYQNLADTLRDAESKLGITGKTVELRTQGTQALLDTKSTDANGAWSFAGVPVGSDVYIDFSAADGYNRGDEGSEGYLYSVPSAVTWASDTAATGFATTIQQYKTTDDQITGTEIKEMLSSIITAESAHGRNILVSDYGLGSTEAAGVAALVDSLNNSNLNETYELVNHQLNVDVSDITNNYHPTTNFFPNQIGLMFDDSGVIPNTDNISVVLPDGRNAVAGATIQTTTYDLATLLKEVARFKELQVVTSRPSITDGDDFNADDAAIWYINNTNQKNMYQYNIENKLLTNINE